MSVRRRDLRAEERCRLWPPPHRIWAPTDTWMCPLAPASLRVAAGALDATQSSPVQSPARLFCIFRERRRRVVSSRRTSSSVPPLDRAVHPGVPGGAGWRCRVVAATVRPRRRREARCSDAGVKCSICLQFQ